MANKNLPKCETLPRTRRTRGQKAADALTRFCGSWTFIASILLFMVIWVSVNIYFIAIKWDPYPFILFNLVLSCIATMQAPIILMSQNRIAERDRAKAERDYAVNRKAEREIEDIQRDLEDIKDLVRELNDGKK